VLCALYLVDCICTGMLLRLFVLCAVLPCHMAKLIECFLFQKPFVMNRLTYNCNAKPPTEISPMCEIPQRSGEWHIVLMTLFRLISIKWNGLFSFRLDYIRYLRMPYLIIIFKSVTILSCYIISRLHWLQALRYSLIVCFPHLSWCTPHELAQTTGGQLHRLPRKTILFLMNATSRFICHIVTFYCLIALCLFSLKNWTDWLTDLPTARLTHQQCWC